MLGWLPVAVSSSHLDRVGMQEGRQVAAVSFPVPSVEAGPIGLQVRGTVVVRGDEMVEQLLAVPQEGLPKVKGGANSRAGSQPVVVRAVEDGEPELVEQVLWHGVVVGHGVLLVVLVGMRRRLKLVHDHLVDQGLLG
jgi:hypothetical protein